jgi:hypothetical protein
MEEAINDTFLQHLESIQHNINECPGIAVQTLYTTMATDRQ